VSYVRRKCASGGGRGEASPLVQRLRSEGTERGYRAEERSRAMRLAPSSISSTTPTFSLARLAFLSLSLGSGGETTRSQIYLSGSARSERRRAHLHVGAARPTRLLHLRGSRARSFITLRTPLHAPHRSRDRTNRDFKMSRGGGLCWSCIEFNTAKSVCHCAAKVSKFFLLFLRHSLSLSFSREKFIAPLLDVAFVAIVASVIFSSTYSIFMLFLIIRTRVVSARSSL